MSFIPYKILNAKLKNQSLKYFLYYPEASTNKQNSLNTFTNKGLSSHKVFIFKCLPFHKSRRDKFLLPRDRKQTNGNID